MIDALKRVHKLGISLSSYYDGSTVENHNTIGVGGVVEAGGEERVRRRIRDCGEKNWGNRVLMKMVKWIFQMKC